MPAPSARPLPPVLRALGPALAMGLAMGLAICAGGCDGTVPAQGAEVTLARHAVAPAADAPNPADALDPLDPVDPHDPRFAAQLVERYRQLEPRR